MHKIFAPLFLVSLVLSACGETTSSKNSPPPQELIGTWQEAVPQASSSGKPADVCDGLSVSKNAVSSFLFKIDEFGNVFDGKNMTDGNQPYRMIGTMNSEGLITPNPEGRVEFLGGVAESASSTFNPIIQAQFEYDTFKGEHISLSIDLQIIANGQTQTFPLQGREYRKISEVSEKIAIGNAQKCLAKAKGI